MKLFFKTLISILFLTAVIILSVPYFIDWNTYKPRIQESFSGLTGLEMRIDGPLNFQILPYPGVNIEGLKIYHPRSKDQPTLLKVDKSELLLSYKALLSGNIVFSKIHLVGPEFYISQNDEGRYNWETDEIRAFTQNKDNSATQSDLSRPGVSMSFQFRDIEVQKGRIQIKPSGRQEPIEGSDLKLLLTSNSLNGPYLLQGEGVFQSRQIGFDIRTEKLVPEAKSVSVTSKITLPEEDLLASYSGAVGLGWPIDMQGELSITHETPQLLLPVPLRPVVADDSLMIKTFLSAGAKDASLDNLRITLGEHSLASGAIKIAFDDGLREVKGTLTLPESSLYNDLYMARSGDSANVAPSLNKIYQDSFSNILLYLSKIKGLVRDAQIEIKLNSDSQKIGGYHLTGLTNNLQLNGQRIENTLKINSFDTPYSLLAISDLNMRIHDRAKEAGDRSDLLIFDASGKLSDFEYLFLNEDVTNEQNRGVSFQSAFAFDAEGIDIDKLYLNANGEGDLNIEGYLKAAKAENDTKKDRQSGSSIKISGSYIDFASFVQNRRGEENKERSDEDSLAKFEDILSGTPVLDGLDIEFSLDHSLLLGELEPADNIQGKARLLKTGARLESFKIKNWNGLNITSQTKLDFSNQKDMLDISSQIESSDIAYVLRAFNALQNLSEKARLPVSLALNYQGSLKEGALDVNLTSDDTILRFASPSVQISDRVTFDKSQISLEFQDMPNSLQSFYPDLNPALELKGPTRLRGEGTLKDQTFSFNRLEGEFAGNTLQGQGKVEWAQTKPLYELALKIDALDTAHFLKSNAFKSSRNKTQRADNKLNERSSGSKWSRNALDLSVLHAANMNISLMTQALTHKNVQFENVIFKSSLKGGTFTLDGIEAGLGEGRILGQALLSAGEKAGDAVDLQASLELQEIESSTLLLLMGDRKETLLSGPVNLKTTLNASGISPAALIYSLEGQGELSGKSLIVRGIDINDLSSGLSGITNLGKALNQIESALRSGQSRFDTLTSSYTINEGVMDIDPLKLSNPRTRLTGKGIIDLPGWRTDMDIRIMLTEPENAPDVTFKLQGPLDDPGRTFASNPLKSFLRSRLQNELEGILLDKLDLAPRPSSDSETQNNTSGSSPQEKQVDDATEKEQPRPENRPENRPEKMIEDMLKGILQ